MKHKNTFFPPFYKVRTECVHFYNVVLIKILKSITFTWICSLYMYLQMKENLCCVKYINWHSYSLHFHPVQVFFFILLKGTVSWDRLKKQKFTELGLTNGRGCCFIFFRSSDDFIMKNVYLLRLMPVCAGLIMVSCLFLSFLLITSGV